MVEKIKNGGGDAEAIGKEKEIAEAEKALRNLFSLYESWVEIESKVDENRDKKIDDIVSVVFPPDKKKLIMRELNSEFDKKYSEDVIDKALKNIVRGLVMDINFSIQLGKIMWRLYEQQKTDTK